jgi:hypothetical protein
MAMPLRKEWPESDRPENDRLENDRVENDRPANREPKFESKPHVIDAEIVEEEEISTNDLAQTKRPVGNVSPAVAETRAGVPSQKAEQRTTGSETAPLFPSGELDGLRTRWKEVQVAFVDEPREAVHKADTLVASAMKRLAEVFSEERSRLEEQWDRGGNVSTEDLRVALQRYRTFFERLLSV